MTQKNQSINPHQYVRSAVSNLIKGTDEDDVLEGTSGADIIKGLAGNDLISGLSGKDQLDGGDGNDVLSAGPGDDILDGGAIDDFNPNIVDTLNGDEGNDVFLFRGYYGQGNYSGGDGLDTLDFSSTDKATSERRATDGIGVKVDMTVGVAVTHYQLATDFSWPDPSGQISFNGMENVIGTEQADKLLGDANDNELEGNAGNDVLDGGAGSDTLVGGAGNDSYRVDSLTDVLTELSDGGVDTVNVNISYQLGEQLENLRLGGSNEITGTGNNLDNLLVGNNASNTLSGGDGNDTLDGGALDAVDAGVLNVLNGDAGNDSFLVRGLFGIDSVVGGEGVDSLDFSQPDTYTAARRDAEGAGVKVDIAAGVALDYFRAGKTTTSGNYGKVNFVGIENARGTDQGDSLTGDDGINVFDGGAGSDVLNGAAGDDTLDGGVLDAKKPGVKDTLNGGSDNDTLMVRGFFAAGFYNGDTGIDTLDFSQPDDFTTNKRQTDTAGVKVDLTLGTAATYYRQTDGFVYADDSTQLKLSTIENLRGTVEGDWLNGDSNNNRFESGDGNDVLNGGAGSDTLLGGNGDDTYVVDTNGDEVTELADAGADTVQASIDYTLGDNFEHLILIGNALRATGNDLDNQLTGNAASNTIKGGLGNDTLAAGLLDEYSPAVSDVLDGDAGDDTFRVTGFFGSNQFDGGEGSDLLDFSQPDAFTVDYRSKDSAGVKVDLTTARAYTYFHRLSGFVWNDRNGQIALTNIENVRGSEQDDEISGDANANVLNGDAGSDLLNGGGGDDTLDGGALDSYVSGIADVLNGDAGNDTFLVKGFIGANSFDGGADVDWLDFSQSDEFTVDYRQTNGAGVNVDLNAAIAYTFFLSDTDVAWMDPLGQIKVVAIENIRGTAEGDKLLGDTSNNTIDAGDGNDWLDGGLGIDSLIGGAGDDTYVVDSISDQVVEQNEGGIDMIRSMGSYVLGSNIEHLVLIGSDAVSGVGNELNNAMTGNISSNTLNGGIGSDTLDGGALDEYQPGVTDTLYGEEGSDRFLSRGFFGTGFYNGGDGIDWLDFSQADTFTQDRRDADGAGVHVDLQYGQSYTYYQVSIDFTWTDNNGLINTTNIENVMGTNQGDWLTGSDGSNRLEGAAGDDLLNGGGGADQLIGGVGNDTYVIDSFDDVITENPEEGNDTVVSSIDYQLGNNLENLTLSESTATVAQGNGLANVILGNNLSNTLDGGDGDDTLDGGVSDRSHPGVIDLLNGDAGNDWFLFQGIFGTASCAGGDGADWLDFSQSDTYTYNRRISEHAGVKVNLSDSTAYSYYLASNNSTWNDVDGPIVCSSVENVLGTVEADWLIGDDQGNYLDGGGSSDQIDGGDGNDTLDGGALDSYQSDITDRLSGGLGDDTFLSRGFIGANQYDGGEGSDWLDFSQPDSFTQTLRHTDGAGVKIDFSTGFAFTYYVKASDLLWTDPVGQITLTTIENGKGSDQADLLVGDDHANQLEGGAGNDELNGGSGDDILDAGAVAGSSDTVDGGDGDDALLSKSLWGLVQFDGGEGSDWLDFSQADAETASKRTTDKAGVKADLSANIASTYYLPETGNTVIDGYGEITLTSVENVRGSEGEDKLIGDSHANQLIGAGGGDYIDSGLGNDTLDGGAIDNADIEVTDTLIGGAGDDMLLSTSLYAIGQYSGGDGADWLDFSHPDDYTATARTHDAAGAKVDLLNNKATTFYVQSIGFVWDGITGQLALSGIENIRGTDQADAIDGDNSPNWLDGANGSDWLNGGNGDDTLDGGALDEFSPDVADVLQGGEGNDTFLARGFYGQNTCNGGNGLDWLDFSQSDDYTADHRSSEALGVNVDLSSGAAFTRYHQPDEFTWQDANGQISLISIENVRGSDQNDRLKGDANNNALDAGAGDDWLDGGAGADTMAGGLGDDTYLVDALADQVVEQSGGGLDWIGTVISYSLDDNLENLTLIGTDPISGIGNSQDNFLLGNIANNTLSGGMGNDTLDAGVIDDYAGVVANVLDGGAGDDHFLVRGLFGADSFSGGNGADWLDFSLGDDYTLGRRVSENAGIKVDLSTDAAYTYYVASAQFVWPDPMGKISINSMENIVATAQDDYLIGDDHANVLNGGAGDDDLTGGGGADIFQLGSLLGVDTIEDFSSKDDTIQLDHSVFTAFSDVGLLSTSMLRTGNGVTKAADANDFLIYNTASGNLYYDADGNGNDSSAIVIAVLGSDLRVTNDDFVIV